MPRPEPSAGRLSRTSRPATTSAPERSARADTATTTTTRKRKGTPCKAPSRTEPSLAPASTPILVKVLLKERTRSVASLDNLRSASSAAAPSSPNGNKSGQVDEDERARKRRKKVAARDALLPSVEGYGRGKRAQSATPAGTTADSDAPLYPARGARGRSPITAARRAASPGAAGVAGLAGTSRPGSAYTQHYPIHSSPLSPPNQYRMHRSRSTGPASNSPTLASSSSSSARRLSPPTPASRSPVMTASALNSTTATSPSLAPSAMSYGNAYAMGISAVSNPSPLAKSFSANGGTVADAVAAATAAANAMPPPPPPRARTPSNTQANGGAYRVAELSGTPIHTLHAVAA
ncbi:hypothetical protein BMF94_5321 [Rhodotorula taiwanensis]|uniref:Uncharacterized protein n=1 Tax=Rhodotorula taiwanensis TaxID=741276 RepID=A0A2S5B4D1_9BASI|nr:hypothetical protein BMF94_5321 [Rhodotorula taiwanensis]